MPHGTWPFTWKPSQDRSTWWVPKTYIVARSLVHIIMSFADHRLPLKINKNLHFTYWLVIRLRPQRKHLIKSCIPTPYSRFSLYCVSHWCIEETVTQSPSIWCKNLNYDLTGVCLPICCMLCLSCPLGGWPNRFDQEGIINYSCTLWVQICMERCGQVKVCWAFQ
mgnify:CR=1 FL=1